MSTSAQRQDRARRQLESRTRTTRFPMGLRAFGQRWEDRQFEADAACRELLELVADIPSLRPSAHELVQLWSEKGSLSIAERQRIEESLGGDPGRSTPETRAAEETRPETSMPPTGAVIGADSPQGAPGEAGVRGVAEMSAEIGPGDVVAGRYEVVRRVEGGSMGVVYQAIDRRESRDDGDRYVALKLVSDGLAGYGPAIRGLQQEAQTGQLLDHPRIVRTLGLERDGHRFFIVMEWLPGDSLARWLSAHPGDTMSVDRLEPIMADLGAALSYAHDRGVVHADVKPGNIILRDDGGACLCDFGVARFDAATMPGGGAFDPTVLRAATPAYASPQVLEGEKPGPKDDIYSLAAVAYRLLSGRRVHGRRDAREAAVANLHPVRIDGLDDERWRILEAALSARAEERPDSVSDFVAAFGAIRAERDYGAGSRDADDDTVREQIRAIPAVRQLPSPRRRPVSIGLRAIGLVIVAAAIVAGFSYFYFGEERLESALDDVLIRAGIEPPGEVTGAADSRVEESAGSGESSPVSVSDAAEPETGRTSAATDAPGQSGEPAAEARAGGKEEALAGEDKPDLREAGRGGVASPGGAAVPTPPETPDTSAPATADDPVAGAPGPVNAEVTLQLATEDRRPDLAVISAVEDESSVSIRLERADASERRELEIRAIAREDGFEPLELLGGVDADSLVVLPAGKGSHTLDIKLPDDDRITGTRRYGFFLIETGGAGRVAARVEVVVIDDELVDASGYLPAGTVSFTMRSVEATEGEGAVRLRLVRYGATDQSRTVRLAAIPDTATEAEDFAVISGREVTFAPGTDNATVFVPLIDDSIPEGEESFRLVLDDEIGPIGTPSQISIRILDDDL